MEKIPQKDFGDISFLNKPEDSNTPVDKENPLKQEITEEPLEVSLEVFNKMLSNKLKSSLIEKMVSVNVVREIQEFAISLKEKYGPSVYDNALYNILIGSTLEGDEIFEDFEGEDSIINFVENL